ncbi:MAG: DUF3788 family protein [Bacteroidota bacterium]
MASIFINKSVKPNNEMLSDALGRSYRYWEEIKKTLESRYGKLTAEWKYYGSGSGWTLKLLLKKRNLFFFSPCKKYFRIAFVFGDNAVTAVEASDLPVRMIEELKGAKRYVEGRGLRIEVKKKADIKNIIDLIAIKVNN